MIPALRTEETSPIVVRRHARSRLYDGARLCYVSLEDLQGWAVKGAAFVVIDAETGSDITHARLA